MSDYQNQFNFDLAPIQFNYKIGGTNYILREASEDAAIKYRSASLRGAEIVHNDDKGDRTIRHISAASEVEPLLVSLCLFEIIKDGPNNEPIERSVPISTVRSWPARIVKQLFDKAKEISELDEREDLASLRRQHAKLIAKIQRLESNAQEEALKNASSSGGGT